MSDDASPAFDPARFFELARRVGHGKALGLEYRELRRQLDGAAPSLA